MVYRDIIEYVREHLDSDCESKEEARFAIRTHLKSIQDKGGEKPLHERGMKRYGYYRATWTPPSINGIDTAEWYAAMNAAREDRKELFRAAIRKAAIQRKLEAKALMLMEDFNLMDIPTADYLAEAALKHQTGVIADMVKRNYPFEGGKSYGLRVNAFCNMEEPNTPRAVYDRGTVAITVTARALIDKWLPIQRVFNDHRKAIVLDAVQVKKGLIYAQWAVQAKRSRQLVLMRGAFCDNEFVAGYDTEEEVRDNEEAIRTQARVQTVTRGLIGDSDKPRVGITMR